MEKTLHNKIDRQFREDFIKTKIGYGEIIDKFWWDKGHKNGAEIHNITSTGLIIIQNANSKKHITTLIGRPAQIKRYYDWSNEVAPKWLLDIAQEHTDLGYNNI